MTGGQRFLCFNYFFFSGKLFLPGTSGIFIIKYFYCEISLELHFELLLLSGAEPHRKI